MRGLPSILSLFRNEFNKGVLAIRRIIIFPSWHDYKHKIFKIALMFLKLV